MNTIAEIRPAAPAVAWRHAQTAQRLAWLFLSFVLVFGAWEVAGRIPISLTFPTFTATAAAMGRMIADGSLLKAYAVTLQPLLIGLALCGAAGIACGIGMGLSRRFEWLTLPVFVDPAIGADRGDHPAADLSLRHRPHVEGAGGGDPGGSGDRDELLQGHPQHQPVADRDVPLVPGHAARRDLQDHAALCRRHDLHRALRLGVAMGFIGIVIAELLITPTGIGDLITYHRSVADFAEMFAAIASIIMVSALTIAALGAVERRLFRHTSTVEAS